MNLLQIKDIKGKEKAALISTTIINAVENGDVEPIEAIIFLKTISKAIESAEAFLKKDLVDAIEKYGRAGYVGQGVEITPMEVGTSYSFENCADPDLQIMELEMELLKKKIDSKKAFLKTVPLSGQPYTSLDGEICTVYPPIKKSTSSFRFAFK